VITIQNVPRPTFAERSASIQTTEYADSWNFVPVKPGLTPEQNLQETARRNRMLDDYCLELGRDPPGSPAPCSSSRVRPTTPSTSEGTSRRLDVSSDVRDPRLTKLPRTPLGRSSENYASTHPSE
jgi:hypothetical protein